LSGFFNLPQSSKAIAEKQSRAEKQTGVAQFFSESRTTTIRESGILAAMQVADSAENAFDRLASGWN
jgi:hypothetical protein